MKKRITAICLAVLVCVGVILRIWYVNKDNEVVETVIYPMGERVAFGDDFYYSPTDDPYSDYEIAVIGAKPVPVEEYLEEHDLTWEEVWPETSEGWATKEPFSTVYDVELWVRNNSTEQVDSNAAGGTGISFVDFELVTIQDEYQVDTDLFGKLYPQMGSQAKGFAVLPGTETTVHLPYTDLNWMCLTYEDVKNQDTYLRLSMYPTKKMIQVVPEE